MRRLHGFFALFRAFLLLAMRFAKSLCFRAMLVSVIIPVFNASPFLRECLDSLRAQTFADWEAICVDDCSTDDSAKILREYATRDARFVAVFNEKNVRQGAARNLALARARGEYVAFLDADDAFAPDALEKLHARARADALDMLLLSCVRVDSAGHEHAWSYHDFSAFLPSAFPRTLFSRSDCPPKLFWRMPCSCWGTFYSRAFLEKHALRFPEKIFFEDRPFFFDALAAARRVGILDETLYRYRENPNSTVASKGKHLADNIAQGAETLRRVRERGVPADVLAEGVVAHAHDLLKSLGLCPHETLVACREKLAETFAKLFPCEKRAELLVALPNVLDRACARLILGDASFADRLVVRLAALKYAILQPFVSGERRARYIEKSGLARKIFSVAVLTPNGMLHTAHLKKHNDYKS